jgi:hypothetical protein
LAAVAGRSRSWARPATLLVAVALLLAAAAAAVFWLPKHARAAHG